MPISGQTGDVTWHHGARGKAEGAAHLQQLSPNRDVHRSDLQWPLNVDSSRQLSANTGHSSRLYELVKTILC